MAGRKKLVFISSGRGDRGHLRGDHAGHRHALVEHGAQIAALDLLHRIGQQLGLGLEGHLDLHLLLADAQHAKAQGLRAGRLVLGAQEALQDGLVGERPGAAFGGDVGQGVYFFLNWSRETIFGSSSGSAAGLAGVGRLGRAPARPRRRRLRGGVVNSRPVLDARVPERVMARVGDRERLGLAAELQRHREEGLARRQVPELVLQHDASSRPDTGRAASGGPETPGALVLKVMKKWWSPGRPLAAARFSAARTTPRSASCCSAS